jgi:hypothetical protein
MARSIPEGAGEGLTFTLCVFVFLEPDTYNAGYDKLSDRVTG